MPASADPTEAPDAADLTAEVVLLRSAIRRLAAVETVPDRTLKGLAELRHQVEALCTTLRAQRALAPRPEDPAQLAVSQALERIGAEALAEPEFAEWWTLGYRDDTGNHHDTGNRPE
jgi:hypothetical protein